MPWEYFEPENKKELSREGLAAVRDFGNPLHGSVTGYRGIRAPANIGLTLLGEKPISWIQVLARNWEDIVELAEQMRDMGGRVALNTDRESSFFPYEMKTRFYLTADSGFPLKEFVEGELEMDRGIALGYPERAVDAHQDDSTPVFFPQNQPEKLDLAPHLRPALELLSYQIPDEPELEEIAIEDAKRFEEAILEIYEDYEVDLTDAIYSDPKRGLDFETYESRSIYPFERKFGEELRYIVNQAENPIKVKQQFHISDYESIAENLDGISGEGLRRLIEG